MGDGPIPCGRRQEFWEHAHRFDADGSNRAVSADRSSMQLCNGRKRMFADPSSPFLSLSSLPPVHQSTQLPFPLCSPTFSLTPPPPHTLAFSLSVSHTCIYIVGCYYYIVLHYEQKNIKGGRKLLPALGSINPADGFISFHRQHSSQCSLSLDDSLPSRD